MSNFKKWIWLAIFLLECFLIEFIGGWFTYTSVNSWYAQLIKPNWNPPDSIFGIAWSILYLLIGLSGWLVFISKKSPKRTKALFVYGVQLFFNCIWSFFFFFLRSPALGLIDIIILLASILWMMKAFFCVSRLAFFLMIPYLLWTLFAFALNLSLYLLNYTSLS